MSVVDTCAYFEKDAIAIVHVDDAIIISKEHQTNDSIVEYLFKVNENFNMTDEGTLETFLGIEIETLIKKYAN